MTTVAEFRAEVRELKEAVSKNLDYCSGHPALDMDAFERVSRFRELASRYQRNLLDYIGQRKYELEGRVQRERRSLREVKKAIEKATAGEPENGESGASSDEAKQKLRRLEQRKKTGERDLEEAERLLSEVEESVFQVEYESFTVAFDDLKDLTVQVESFKTWLDTKEALASAIRSDFQVKSDIFNEAEAYHRKEARVLLVILGGIAVASSLAVYFLFIKNSVGVGLLAKPAASSIQVIEYLLLLATGRVAILVLAAWAFRFTGSLHRLHSEQSVIYRDRKAALGVAENMLRAGNDREQKQATLKMLADGYLDFEQSAFRRSGKASSKSIAASEKVPELAAGSAVQVQEVVKNAKPLLDSLSRLVQGLTRKLN